MTIPARWQLLLSGAVGLVAILGLPATSFGHPGLRADPDTWWTAWNWDLVLGFNLLVFGAAYARGLYRIHCRGGQLSRFYGPIAATLGGLATLVAALVSPIDALGEALSSVHMAQHMLLMTVAAPLLAMASPLVVTTLGMPRSVRSVLAGTQRWRAWQWSRRQIERPLFIWCFHAGVMWLWHVPLLYESALRNSVVHDLQHLSFFAAAYIFWTPMIGLRSARGMDRGLSVLLLFTTSLHATLLGAFMSFAPKAWYPGYSDTTPLWGLTPLEDQQIAGFIMWIPACSVYALAATILFGLWIHSIGQRGAPLGADRGAVPFRHKPAELVEGL